MSDVRVSVVLAACNVSCSIKVNLTKEWVKFIDTFQLSNTVNMSND